MTRVRETIEKSKKSKKPAQTAKPSRAWADSTHSPGCMCRACLERRLFYGGR